MTSWEEWYEVAKQYYLQHGNLLVPISYVCLNGEKLGKWISRQRQYYRGTAQRGKITAEQATALEKIGMIWNPYVAQWEAAYADAREFYETNGTLEVPENYIGKSGIKLHAWIQNQRSKYFNHGDGHLSPEQIERLEKIGMLWHFYRSKWEQMFLLAKQYYDQNKTLLVPERYQTPDGQNLGNWIQRQRKRRINGEISSDQIEKLDMLDMCWDPYEAQFISFFSEAKSYFLEVGDLDIPTTYVTETGFNLGIWIFNLRKRYKRKELSDEKIHLLESIGMRWDVSPSPVQTSYAEQIVFYYLKRYFPDTQNRDTSMGIELDVFIPQLMVAVEYDGVYWHKNKKANDNKKNIECENHGVKLYRLREKGCPTLNGISVDIVIPGRTFDNLISSCQILLNTIFAHNNISHVPTINFYDDITEIREQYRHAVSDTWNRQFEEATKFYEINGHLRVPFNYVCDTGFHLGAWITNLRSAYAGYSGVGISQERIDRLNSIGMIWSVPEEQWEQGYFEATQYYAHNGNLRVPIHYMTENGYKLGVWVRSQRKKSALSPSQIDRLDKIGMIWDVYSEDWERGYEKAKEFFTREGHLRVPAKYVSDGFPLGNWIATQRGKYKAINEKALSSEQIDSLNAIGMIWDVQEVLWEEGYAHASQYFQKNGNLLVPNKYKCEDGFTLGAWIASRRGGYNGYGSWACPTESQIHRLEAIGMIWDVEEYYWMQHYCLAKEYYDTHGNLQIPKRFVTPQGVHLGIWIQSQRRMFRGKSSNKNLTAKRIELLNQIGMIW